MPAVLRSRIKAEDEGETEPKSSSPKAFGRRIKRRKRNSTDSENGEISGSDGYLEHSHGPVGNSRPFEMVGGVPSSLGVPEYSSTLTHPLSVKDSAVLYYSLVNSRKTWVRGEMFELYFTKAAKPVKDSAGATEAPAQAATIQMRDKMQKLCDCTMLGGPHTFPVRLFILKDEEMEKKWHDEQDMRKKEREEARRKVKEEKQRLAEMKKEMQQKKKQEREKLLQLRKENKAKGRVEQEVVKQRRKNDVKKQNEHQNLKRAGSIVSNSSTRRSPAPSSQSVTNPKMIANLNLMAQKDRKLNTLMGIVANGDATLEQVEEFKKFIEIAKNMPPPPGWTPPPQAVQQTERKDAHPSASNVEDRSSNKDEAATILSKDPEKERADEEDIKPTVKGEFKHSEGTAIKKEANSRRKKGDNSIQQAGNNSDEKSMHLTAFQQKYVHGAQIILEYTEYTTPRYLLPKNAIIEFVEDDGSFLLSWIIVHNDADIKRHRSKRIRELSKSLKSEEEKEELAKNYDVYSERGCPTPLYSPMTVKFTGIHPKFARILLNSVDPAEKVRKAMTTIMEIGTRLSGYNLWYQLDAYDDKDLAEKLRVKLNEHEEESKGRKHRQ
ncbi:hypothetical protein HG536_0F03640 [Torulaspora globosa]|uniref:SWR1-complex protein 3 n=1 Tax=Torulaspora globosa TaxID=48254 RepID=A0A7G3ZKK3_9SACH|nr:uncharacterized protein HG536_0F03640 [Torulaspora globosa]QLL34039.1 hypothetical protein HG536_0F03640 [Torulaspora globosa]